LSLCISNNIDDAKVISADTGSSVFVLDNIGDFPGSRSYTIQVNINGNGAILKDDTVGQLLICGENCETSKYCVNSDDIYKIQTGNSECSNVHKDVGKEILYFNERNELTDDKGLTKKAYLCEFKDDQTEDSCIVVDKKMSIIVEDKGILTCDAVNGCVLNAPSSSNSIIYDRMSTNDCLTDNTVCTQETGTSGYLYTCIYDSENSSVKCSLITNVGYYIDKVEDKDYLYTCTNNEDVKCVKSLKTVDDDTSTCSGSNNGEVLYLNSKFVICTGNNNSLELKEKDSIYYFYGSEAIGTYAIDSDKYGIIKASSSMAINYTSDGK